MQANVLPKGKLVDETTGRSFTISPTNKVTLELALLGSILATAMFGTFHVTKITETIEHTSQKLAVHEQLIREMQKAQYDILLVLERLKK